MTKHAAARTYNISESTLDVWLRKYAEGGQEALLEDNRGRKPSMGRKPEPKLSDYEPGSLEYVFLQWEINKNTKRIQHFFQNLNLPSFQPFDGSSEKA